MMMPQAPVSNFWGEKHSVCFVYCSYGSAVICCTEYWLDLSAGWSSNLVEDHRSLSSSTALQQDLNTVWSDGNVVHYTYVFKRLTLR